MAGHDAVAQGGHLPADDCDQLGFAAGVGDESGLVVAKDELPDEREGLCTKRIRPCGTTERSAADRDRVGITENMPCVYNKDVRPATFLMDDTRKFAGVIVPWRLGLASEALDTTKRRVLRSFIDECDGIPG